jgi:glycosyltransferase involved in cell wall biosynthesis
MIPAVSVVIATYNYGRFLAGALNSVLGQTVRDLEAIVVDDGSSDDTSSVIEPFLADPRLRYLRADHIGQAAAKNTGIRLARAPLIAFLDADDAWLPEKLEQQTALLEIRPEVGVVYGRRLLMDEQGRDLEVHPVECHRGNVLAAIFRDNFICFSSVVLRRQVLDEVGLFDETLPLAVDYDLWLRTALRFPFDYVDGPLVKYRTGHASLSRRIEDRLAVIIHIMNRFLEEYGGRAALSAEAIRRAQAQTYYHMALYRRPRSRLGALSWYLRCLALAPGYGLAWRGLASLALPEAARRGLRVALGRPADWAVRQFAAEQEKDFALSHGRSVSSCPPAA